jgi:putative protease
MEQFEIAISVSEANAVIVHYDKSNCSEIIEMAAAAKEKEKEFILSLPPICRLSVYERLRRDLSDINDNENICGYLVQNFEETALLQSLFKEGKHAKKIILNYNMYIYNKEAKEFWKEIGITDFTAPVELNYQELKTLEITDCDMIVYGYQPLMVSAQCLYENTSGCRKVKNRANTGNDRGTGEDSYEKGCDDFGELTDRIGKKFYVQTNCSSCYNIIYNGQALFLIKQEPEIRKLAPKNIRLDFTMETAEEMKQVITACADTYCYGKKTVLEHSDYTTGHFKRGVE